MERRVQQPAYKQTPSVAVVYLARGYDDGLASFHEFIKSYATHPAGVGHSLLVLAKGWQSRDALDDVTRSTDSHGGSLIELPDDGFDWGAYFRVAPSLTQDWACLLNTHSRIISDNWLGLLTEAVQRPGIGAAGATGSWESAAKSVWDLQTPPGGLGKLRHAMRILYNWMCFPCYPNPHLRSNAIILRTALLRGFAKVSDMPVHKRDAQRLESGRRGLSAYIRRQGLSLVVCGADGRVFGESEWPESRTFRQPDHTNLLVEDNQTRLFESANPQLRKALQRAAWGFN